MISLFTITTLLRSPTVQSPKRLTLTHRPYTMSGEPVLFFTPQLASTMEPRLPLATKPLHQGGEC